VLRYKKKLPIIALSKRHIPSHQIVFFLRKSMGKRVKGYFFL